MGFYYQSFSNKLADFISNIPLLCRDIPILCQKYLPFFLIILGKKGGFLHTMWDFQYKMRDFWQYREIFDIILTDGNILIFIYRFIVYEEWF